MNMKIYWQSFRSNICLNYLHHFSHSSNIAPRFQSLVDSGIIAHWSFYFSFIISSGYGTAKTAP